MRGLYYPIEKQSPMELLLIIIMYEDVLHVVRLSACHGTMH